MRTAILFGVAGIAMLAACGGTQGTSEGIGKSGEALSIAAAADLANAVDTSGNPASPTPAGLEWSAHCLIKDGTGVNDPFKMLVVGGYNSSGVGQTTAFMYSGSGNWVKVASLPADGRGEARMIRLSGSDNKCLIAGGLSNKSAGSARTSTYIFTANGASGSWASAGSLPVGRAKFAMANCGTGKAVIFGGHTASGPNSPVTTDDAEVWDGTTTWTGSTGLLVNPISDFAFAAKDSTKFVLAGGKTNTGVESAVQAFTATSSCSLTALNNVADLRLQSTPASTSGRFGAVAFFKSGTDELYVTAGRDGAGNHPTDRQRFDVTWSGASSGVAYNTQSTSYITAVRNPTLASDGTNLFLNDSKLLLIGGEDNTSATPIGSTPVTTVQEINLSTLAVTTANLSSARLGSSGQYVPATSKIYAAQGMSSQTGPTLLTTSEAITP